MGPRAWGAGNMVPRRRRQYGDCTILITNRNTCVDRSVVVGHDEGDFREHNLNQDNDARPDSIWDNRDRLPADACYDRRSTCWLKSVQNDRAS